RLHGLHLDARGERGREQLGKPLQVDGDLPLGKGHVDVLPQRLVPRRQGEPEAELRTGREALGVGDRQVGAAQRPLPDAGDVAVAGEADLAELREADADPFDGSAGGHDRPPDDPTPLAAGSPAREVRSTTGTAPPVRRSWPVPWLPPAGGVAEATTCSMP